MASDKGKGTAGARLRDAMSRLVPSRSRGAWGLAGWATVTRPDSRRERSTGIAWARRGTRDGRP
jgi:hypothetical protein